MPGGATESLERLAARFDQLYTRMTAVQRELIAAARGDAEPSADLLERARTLLAAVDSADWALAVGQPSRRNADADALRARVLRTPVDGGLLRAALAALGRREGVALIAGAVRLARSDGTLETSFVDVTIADVLAAPRSMGEATARRLAVAIDVDPDAVIAHLDGDVADRLAAALDDIAAGGLPDGVEPWRRTAPRVPEDGRGAGSHVLDGWVDASGSPTDARYQAALAASRRDGWPADAPDTAAALVRFTAQQLMPSIVEGWEALAAIDDPEVQLRALRAEKSRYFDTRDEDAFATAWLVSYFIDAVVAARKARRLAAGPAVEWGSATPMACARTAGRRCGDILACLEGDDLIAALDGLPAALPPGGPPAALA